MKKLSKAIVPLLCVIVAGLFLIMAVNRFKSYDRLVSVRGLCEKEVKADQAIYPISFTAGGNDLQSVNANVKDCKQRIVEFLKTNGFEDSEISVSAPSISDNRNESYRSAGVPDFTVRSTVTVCTPKVDSVLALQNKLSELVEQGIAINVNEWNVTYNFTGLNDIKPQMIEEANKAARAAGEQFAKDSDSRLGKIKEASQGLFSIENRDQNTPYIKKVRVVTYVNYYLR